MTKTTEEERKKLEELREMLNANPSFFAEIKTVLKEEEEVVDESFGQETIQESERKFSGLQINFNNEEILYMKTNIGLIDLDNNASGPRKVNEYGDSDQLIKESRNRFNLNEAHDTNALLKKLDYNQLRSFLDEKQLHKYVGDENLLKSALNECNSIYTNTTSCGEMFFQQTVYSAFSRLFMAFSTRLDCYAADEDVHSSVLSKMIKKGETKIKNCDATVRPDAASTMSENKLDPFGMMEIKPKDESWDLLQRRDYNKSVLLTASTAIVMKNAQMNTSDIVLPFLIGRGKFASLYVTVWNGDQHKHIEIQQVEPPCNIAESLISRKKVFISLVALLARARYKMDNPEFQSYFANSRWVGKDEEMAFTTDKTKKRKLKDSQGSNDGENSEDMSINRSDKKQRGNSNKEKEELALRAAQNHGMFIRVKYPWLRLEKAFEENSSISYQNVSPYLFKGIHRESGKEVFLKVWREGEDKVDYRDIELEYKYHKLAQDRKVPTAPLITNELLCSTVSNVQFYVLATAYVGTHDVPKNDIWPFSIKLVSALINLHENAFLLHCDVKPNNVTWNSSMKSLNLIDFGHAQPEKTAKAYRCTVGYEAPEIVSGHCHTRSTDAYAVGRTLMKVLDRVSNVEEFTEIREIANQLVKEENERWTLDSALKALETANFSQAKYISCVSPPKKILKLQQEKRFKDALECNMILEY